MKNISKQILALLLLSVFLFSCAGENPQAKQEQPRTEEKTDLISAAAKSVFCISIGYRGKDLQPKTAIGTAFLIEGGWLASARHVQIKLGQMTSALSKEHFEIIAWREFENGDYIQFPVELFVSDEISDMAVFRFDGKELKTNPKFSAVKPLKLAENLPAIGAEVVAVGFYGDYRFPFHSAGRVSMIDKNEDIFSDVTIIPGNSGAPVFSTETGEVLGITVSVLDIGRETVRFGIAKRASKLTELLQRLEKKN